MSGASTVLYSPNMPERFLKTPITSAREKITLAAFDLFHAHGIEGTSVDDILKSSGTGKSQFYHYFKSKDGLVHEMMEMARKKVKDGEIIGCEPIESWGDLKAWLESAIEKMAHYNFTRACPLGRFASEIPEGDEWLRKDVMAVFEAKKQYPKDFFVGMKARGELTDDADPDSLADFCLSTLQGAMLMGKLYQDEAHIRSAVEHCYRYLKSFSK